MAQAIWKTQFDTIIHRIGRDLEGMARDGKYFVDGLNTTERLVLAGLVMIGLFFLLLHQFQKRDGGEHGEGKFVGFLFLLVAMATGAGWMISGDTA